MALANGSPASGRRLDKRHSLRMRQIAALRQIVHLNTPAADSLGTEEPVWKVLVYDRYGQDVIGPLLSVKDLRELGVTLHLLLDSSRDQIPDVPAVYLVCPTEENLRLIAERDLAGQLYAQYYFNFIGALPRTGLELLATEAVRTGQVHNVNKVYDQFVNFISLEDDLFTLRRHSDDCDLSYFALNCPSASDAQMERALAALVDALFAVCVTYGQVPIIRCPRGNAAEHVAERLDKKIRDNLRDARNNMFAGDAFRAGGGVGFERPLLVVVDRTMDLATMLHHTWTYQALVHDVLELELNRVTVHEPSADGQQARKKAKEYDMNVADKFWLDNKGRPFPEVAEAVQEQLERYRSSEAEIKRLKAAMGLGADADEAISMLNDATHQLTTTVTSLPQLLEQKRLIDLHTNVATAVLEHIKARKLDTYFEAEERLMNKQSSDRPVMDILKDPEVGSAEDKLRLALLYYIINDAAGEQEVAQLMLALEAAGCDDAAFAYVKKWKQFTRMISGDQYTGGGTKAVSMFSKLLNHSSQLFMEGVKNLVIKQHKLPVTKIVDALMEQKSMNDVDDYRYFDPKLLRNDGVMPRARSQFNEAIVFVVGGGNYVEYQNLMDYRAKASATAQTPKRITYGCTDLCNADQFLKQLNRLGQC